MRNNRRWKKVCAAFLAAACFSGTVSQGFCGSSFVCAEETETETEAETVYSQKDLELLENVEKAEADGEDGLDADSIDWGNADIQVMEDEDVSNLLLIGQDRREGQDRQRSDSIIICSVNKEKGKIVLTSIMRDLYVPIPSYKDNRINAAYQFGGMELLDEVIEENLGIHIDGNIEVDFDGFMEALSVLGDLDIELNATEANYLNEHSDLSETDETGWELKEGMNSMTPAQLLAYSRTRFIGNSDWERTERQRKVLTAAYEKAKKMNVFNLVRLAYKIFPNFTTDLSIGQVAGYIYTVLTGSIEGLESYRIPVDGTYNCVTLAPGMEVLIPDLTANSSYLQQFIYGVDVFGNVAETEKASESETETE